MSDKPKFAMYWASSCGGCEIAVLNIGEKILDVDANFDVAFWPVAMDAKYKDVEAMEDGSIMLTPVQRRHPHARKRRDGQVAAPQEQDSGLVRFVRDRRLHPRPGEPARQAKSSIRPTARSAPITQRQVRPQRVTIVPEGELTYPEFNPVVRTLDQVVPVDYYMPGCPPESHQIAAVIDLVIQVLQGKAQLPPKGSVIGAGASTVCDECPRERNVKKITKFVRIQEVAHIDPELCLLEQGIPCNGPATRQGCGALCPQVAAQCIGCYGPAEGVVDYGARLITAFASVIDAKDPAEIERILDGIPDPVGQFYRFNLGR